MNHDTTTTNPQRDSDAAQAAQAQPDVFPDFAISLEEADRRVKMLKEFVRDHMQEGEDYGVIPGASPKPVLFKPGAEKLNAIFGLAPIVEITNRVEDWDNGFVAYEVKVTLLNKRTTNIEAEGIGSCNSRERRYKNQDAANVANTILKMAKKRGLVDATLSATRASGLFTQDLEDIDHDAERAFNANNHRFPENGRAPEPRFEPREARNETRPADNARPAFSPATPAHAANVAAANANVLTEAQRGAILAIANKVFGRTTKEEMAKLVDKPITQLSKSEASMLIDKLRNMLPEQPAAQAPREEYAAGRNGSR